MDVRELLDDVDGATGSSDDQPGHPDRLVPDVRLPQPAGEEGQGSAGRGDVQEDVLPYAILVPCLRYAIDKRSVAAVKLLVELNPKGVRSRHVAHNIGASRIDWMREEGFLG